MKTIEKIVYMSTKGQITLPMAWRRKIGTSAVRIRESNGDRLEILPVDLKNDEETGWVSIFDSKEKRPTTNDVLKFLQKNKEGRNTKKKK